MEFDRGKDETGSARHNIPHSMEYCPADIQSFRQNTTLGPEQPPEMTIRTYLHYNIIAVHKHNGKVSTMWSKAMSRD